MKQVYAAAALAVVLSAIPAQASLPTSRAAGDVATIATADDEPPCNYIRVRCPHK